MCHEIIITYKGDTIIKAIYTINTLRFLVVRVCDGCGCGRNGFAGRVQKKLSQKWP